jgi:hypothetical protein
VHVTHASTPSERTTRRDERRHQSADVSQSAHVRSFLTGTRQTIAAHGALLVVATALLKERNVLTIVDNGSERTILNSAVVKLTTKSGWTRTTISVTTADGTMQPKQGWLISKLSVSCRGARIACRNVLVMELPELPYGLLVGNDALTQHAAQIDCANGTVRFPAAGTWSAPGPCRWQPAADLSGARARRMVSRNQGSVV